MTGIRRGEMVMFASKTWQCGHRYETLESKGFNPDEWETCPKCGAKPRVRMYDNGLHATCKCFDKYEPKVQAESIMSVHKRTGNTLEYDCDNLRLAWNEYVKTGVRTPLSIDKW